MSALSQKEFLNLFPGHIFVSALYNAETHKYGKWARNIAYQQALLDNEKGMKDIFFTPNGNFMEACGGYPGTYVYGDKDTPPSAGKANAKQVYCFFVEIDSGEKDWAILGSDFYPNIIVKTRKGYHVYWLFDNPIMYKDFSSTWDTTQNQLVDIFGGDGQAKDVARLLRVPDFRYWKGTDGALKIGIESYSEKRYSFKKLSERIGSLHKAAGGDNAEKAMMKKKFGSMKAAIDDLFYEISKLDVTEVAERVTRGSYRHSGGGSMYIDGSLTNGYKYMQSGNYLNNFGESSQGDRPVGGPRCVARFFIKNSAECIEWFRKEYGIKSINTSDVQKFEVKREKTESVSYLNTPQTKIGDLTNYITIDRGQNRTFYQQEYESQTMFIGTLRSVGYSSLPNGDKIIIIEATDGNGEKRIRVLKPIGTDSEFRKFLFLCGIALEDTPKKFIGMIISDLMSTTERYGYTNKLGLQYIDGKKYIISKGGIYIDSVNKVMIDAEDSADMEIQTGSYGGGIKKYVTQLLNGYKGHVGYTAFLSCCLGANAWYFRNARYNLPMFFVLGLSGVGKTYLMERITRSMGYTYGLAATSKAFTYRIKARHYMPIYRSDYRDHALQGNKEDYYAIFRHIFDNKPVVQGTAGQMTKVYETNAQYIFCGQTIYEDDACLTRTIITSAKKANKGDKFSIESLPLINADVTSIFENPQDFQKFLDLSELLAIDVQKELSASGLRSDDRICQNFSLLMSMGRRLGLEQYEPLLRDSIREHASMVAHDDINMVYQKVLNLQFVNGFEAQIFKGGMIVHIIEEGMRYQMQLNSLKGFITTVNSHFLGANTLQGLSCYVDFNYVFKNKELRGPFSRALSRTNGLRASLEGEEEKKSYIALQEFINNNYPDHDKLNEINEDINVYMNIKEERARKAGEEKIDLDI